jgi:hypothetical protein
VAKILSVIATLIAIVIQYIKGSRESEIRTDTRVRQLEDNLAKERARRLQEFDEKAAAVGSADDAVELLRTVTADDPTLN